MSIPNENSEIIIGNIRSLSDENNLAIKSDNSPFLTSFYFNDFYDERAIKKFIKSTEKLIRGSREYGTYIELLRTNITSLNHDNILLNITTSDVDLEFHHYPFSLYDIVETVISSKIFRDEKFTTFSVAKEVMALHYQHIIGLVPLTKTTHELAHSGNLFIGRDQIFGNYKKFMELYKDGISAAMKQKVDDMEYNSDLGAPSDFKGLLNG